MLVSYSIKYRNYQRAIREGQVVRALEAIKRGGAINSSQNDYKRFIKRTHCTSEGELARESILTLNEDAVAQESVYDGLYAVCTSLTDDAMEIIRINKRRWEIEESSCWTHRQ